MGWQERLFALGRRGVDGAADAAARSASPTPLPGTSQFGVSPDAVPPQLKFYSYGAEVPGGQRSQAYLYGDTPAGRYVTAPPFDFPPPDRIPPPEYFPKPIQPTSPYPRLQAAPIDVQSARANRVRELQRLIREQEDDMLGISRAVRDAQRSGDAEMDRSYLNHVDPSIRLK